MRNPLKSVTFKITALVCLFVLGVIGLMAQRLFKRVELDLRSEMRLRGDFFARRAREAIFPKIDPFQLHFVVEETAKEKAVTYAAVMDDHDKILSHTRPERIGETMKDPVTSYDVVVPLVVGAKTIGSARLGFNDTSLDEALREPKRQIAVIALAATGLAILGTVLIVGWITRPIPRLAAAARAIGKGDFSARVEIKSGDEIGLLATAFNDMAISNSLLFTTIRQEKEKLETIFHETREGLVWTDPAGRVLLINPSARALLGAQEKVVDTLQDAASGFSIKPVFDDVFAGRARITPVELQRPEPKLLILAGVADRLGDEKDPAGYLFVFHDATLEKRGETLSRNFLSIVSHKLRTPLAVALGFTEILLGEPESLNDMQKGALGKVRTEAEKLQRLVEKLITFSTVQSPANIVLEKSDFHLSDTVDAVLNALQPVLKGAEIDWDETALEDLPKVHGDAFLLKEAIANLIENSVKFNTKPDRKTALRAEAKDGTLKISVTDNGPGIPGEEQPKLFRKFYQIDEHFTGQIPGFGLGLAFVKTVAQAHGGDAGLRSELGKGSEFWFSIPLKKA